MASVYFGFAFLVSLAGSGTPDSRTSRLPKETRRSK
jgi:hypothetical protein